MPTLNIDHTNIDDIIDSMELLEKLLPGITMYLVDTTNTEAVEQLIDKLRTFLPQPLKAPAQIPDSWTPYDEIVTLDILIELAQGWPEVSSHFLGQLKSYYSVLVGPIVEGTMPFKHNVYKGHIFHTLLKNFRVSKMRPQTNKRDKFWAHVLNTWNLPSTPKGWIPPDMR